MKIAAFLHVFTSLSLVASSPVPAGHSPKSPAPIDPISRGTSSTSVDAIPFFWNSPAGSSGDLHDPESGTSRRTPTPGHTQQDSEPSIVWDPLHVPERDLHKRIKFQDACRQALRGKDCERATIYAGKHREEDHGRLRKYHKVSVWRKGDKSEKGRIMRLYYDGSSRWHPRDAKETGHLHGPGFRDWKRRRREDQEKYESPGPPEDPGKDRMDEANTTIPEPDASMQAPTRENNEEDNSKLKIFWSPVDAYQKKKDHAPRRKFFESACRQALRGERCRTATIYLNFLREQNSWAQKRYHKVVVEGDGDADRVRIMRLYHDGAYQWHPKDATGKSTAPRPLKRRPKPRKPSQAAAQALAQEPAEDNVKPRIFWDPPDFATTRSDRLQTRILLQDSCRRALQGQYCETVTIHGGLGAQKTQLSSVMKRYYLASAKKNKDDDADKETIIRLYTDGSSEYHPTDAKWKGKVHGARKDNRKRKLDLSGQPGAEAHAQAQAVHTEVQAQAPGEGENQHLDAYSGENMGHLPALSGGNLEQYPTFHLGEYSGGSFDLDHLSPGGWWD